MISIYPQLDPRYQELQLQIQYENLPHNQIQKQPWSCMSPWNGGATVTVTKGVEITASPVLVPEFCSFINK